MFFPFIFFYIVIWLIFFAQQWYFSFSISWGTFGTSLSLSPRRPSNFMSRSRSRSPAKVTFSPLQRGSWFGPNSERLWLILLMGDVVHFREMKLCCFSFSQSNCGMVGKVKKFANWLLEHKFQQNYVNCGVDFKHIHNKSQLVVPSGETGFCPSTMCWTWRTCGLRSNLLIECRVIVSLEIDSWCIFFPLTVKP